MLARVTVFCKLDFHRLTHTEKALKWNGSLPRIDPNVNFPSIYEHLCSSPSPAHPGLFASIDWPPVTLNI